MSILLIEKKDADTRAALICRERLYAYHSDTHADSLWEEQILLGTVDRNAKGISGAFVRLPRKEYGFLPFSAGEKSLPSGSRVLVQVKRPPSQSKKALLSRDIALPGVCIVYLPLSSGLRVSNRCGAEEKARLRDIGKRISPKDGGVILRSEALNAPEKQIAAELQALRARWQFILAQSAGKSEPCLLWGGESAVGKLLREEAGRLEYILTNDPATVPADCAAPIRFSEHPFMLWNVERKLETSLRRTVRMKSGADLVIDRCEAMTVIDVNSAMAAGGRSIGDTAVKINREAVWEVARLMRLRSMGGMILVDLIDMETDDDREALLREMRAALAEDPVKTTVHDITTLGIMEITRHRTQEPPAAQPDIPCPHCGGTGLFIQYQEEDAADA